MASKFILISGAVLLLAAGGALVLATRPPALLRDAANHGAKTVCSNVFLAGRDAEAVLAQDVQASDDPVLNMLKVRVDRERKLVRAELFGFIGGGMAVYRPGTGCAVVADGDVAAASKYQYKPLAIWAPSPNVPWPTGSQPETMAAVQALVDQDSLAGPGMRGIAVIYRGRLIAQRYGAGFKASTVLSGGSMTRTVGAALAGIELAEGKSPARQDGLLPVAAAQNPAPAFPLSLPHDHLFSPLGMSSAVMEADARGNLGGDADMYASTQDWARFGQFLLQDGVWQGKRFLPEGFVASLRRATPKASGADAALDPAADTYWLQGAEGQSIAIVPSKQLALVRLGMTPQGLGYQPQAMLAAILKAVD
jgi:CubicO group peptidase (beta-lactamase class C family)